MKIKLKMCEHMGDWYTIVRAEHDGREWWVETGPNSSSWHMSERLTPNACIEGNAAEMLAIARAIKVRGSEAFKRCAVAFNDDGAHFWSPKNSTEDAIIPVADADAFADEVLRDLAPAVQAGTAQGGQP